MRLDVSIRERRKSGNFGCGFHRTLSFKRVDTGRNLFARFSSPFARLGQRHGSGIARVRGPQPHFAHFAVELVEENPGPSPRLRDVQIQVSTVGVPTWCRDVSNRGSCEPVQLAHPICRPSPICHP